MSKTKIVIALVAITAIALVAVGLASAQIAANQTYAGTTTNTSEPNSGFLGWIGRCFDFRGNQAYYSSPYVAPQVPTTSSTIVPYAPYQPSQPYGNRRLRIRLWTMLGKIVNSQPTFFYIGFFLYLGRLF